jgi:acyl carrier protein
MNDAIPQERKLKTVLEKISHQSVSGHYNPYVRFDWPELLDEDRYWMSQELMSLHGTPFADWLTEAQKQKLSKWESINFYSLNVHGIRELLHEAVERVQASAYEAISIYLHHVIGEENAHMWFFAKFCKQYGGKIYAANAVPTQKRSEQDLEDFLVFSRIVIFEEIVDHYNTHMGKDASLAPIIQELNRVHHEDEARHVAFGRTLLSALWPPLKEKYDEKKLAEVAHYLKRYMKNSLRSLYNPETYRDAGIESPEHFAEMLFSYPGRQEHHVRALKRTYGFFHSLGVFKEEAVASVFRESSELNAVSLPEEIRAFVLRTGRVDSERLTDELDLFENEVLDSLAVMDLLTLLEKRTGRRIPREQIDTRKLQSLTAINKNFIEAA